MLLAIPLNYQVVFWCRNRNKTVRQNHHSYQFCKFGEPPQFH